MKAYVYREYGSADVLKLTEVEKPVPKDNEVLIKIMAVSVNSADIRYMRGKPRIFRLMFGFFKPAINILGADVAGIVEAVGSAAKKFKPGDEVYGFLSDHGFGGFAEYVSTTEDQLVKKPAGIPFEEAAAVPLASYTALAALRNKGNIQPGQSVLINGASGGVGTFAIQIAKYLGAEVTAVSSSGKEELVRSLGADHFIDYKTTDFTKSGRKYDLIAGVNGYHPLSHYLRSLKDNGIYIMVGGKNPQIFHALLFGKVSTLFSNKKIICLTDTATGSDLDFISELLVTGKIKPVIEKRYSFDELPDAVRYCDEGHPAGKAVVRIN
ncbi:MAG: alcohol dehydrogenase [Spirochaetes bacterium GWF1_51_8]|nr:MAG: alcohol dehydrogenase [Spirochaetes bacterium GWF1_51_8]